MWLTKPCVRLIKWTEWRIEREVSEADTAEKRLMLTFYLTELGVTRETPVSRFARAFPERFT